MLESPENRALDDTAKLKLVNDYVNHSPFCLRRGAMVCRGLLGYPH